MPRTFAFIDESGNSNLETTKQDVSRYYILVSVISNQQSIEQLRINAEKIRKKHFQSGEIKSSNVKDKDRHHRRISILKDIIELDFKFYAMAFNKEALRKDSGLQFKRSFIKFCNKLLYKNLFAHFDDIKITADAQGNAEFIESFRAYIENEKPDLFWRSECEMISSHEDVLIQLADFIAGTMAKRYEGKANPELIEAYRALITKKALGIDEWPTKDQMYFAPDSPSSEFDGFIMRHSIAKAEDFLDKSQSISEAETRAQCCLLSYLLFKCRFDPGSDYIGTHELKHHLIDMGFHDITDQAIRSAIIAPLRDSGVIISSCTKGYKIPNSHGDLLDFIHRVDSQVVPLLERLNKARKSFHVASQGEIDLLKGIKFPILVALLKQLESETSSNPSTPKGV